MRQIWDALQRARVFYSLTGFSIHGIMKMYLWNLQVWCFCVCPEHPHSSTCFPTTYTQSAQPPVTEQQIGIRATEAKLKANRKMPQMTCQGHNAFSSGLKQAQVENVKCLLTTATLLLSCRAQREQAQEGSDWGSSENSNVCFENSWLLGHELVGFFLALKTQFQNLSCPKWLCQQINVISGMGENSYPKWEGGWAERS